jgi:hypothetical protein
MHRQCNLVGRSFYTSVLITPDDTIRIVPEPTNRYDKNAHRVEAWLENEWKHVGYVERETASYLVNRTVTSARILSVGKFHASPMAIEAY